MLAVFGDPGRNQSKSRFGNPDLPFPRHRACSTISCPVSVGLAVEFCPPGPPPQLGCCYHLPLPVPPPSLAAFRATRPLCRVPLQLLQPHALPRRLSRAAAACQGTVGAACASRWLPRAAGALLGCSRAHAQRVSCPACRPRSASIRCAELPGQRHAVQAVRGCAVGPSQSDLVASGFCQSVGACGYGRACLCCGERPAPRELRCPTLPATVGAAPASLPPAPTHCCRPRTSLRPASIASTLRWTSPWPSSPAAPASPP